MTATDTASQLARKHGVTRAAALVGERVRRWAAWTDTLNGRAFPLKRLRFWLAVDWELHHNPRIPC